jgi:hypothetical protein
VQPKTEAAAITLNAESAEALPSLSLSLSPYRSKFPVAPPPITARPGAGLLLKRNNIIVLASGFFSRNFAKKRN